MMATFTWTKRREQAALLVAQDDLTNEQIAAQIGVTRRCLDKWKRHPEFAARVASLVADMREAVRQRGIADKQNRIDDLNEVRNRLWRVFDERAADPELSAAPGGSTGLLVRTFKIVRSGEETRELEEYAVDTGALKELREYLKQAAIEVSEWTEKKELTGKGGGPLQVQVDLSLIGTADLLNLLEAIKSDAADSDT